VLALWERGQAKLAGIAVKRQARPFGDAEPERIAKFAQREDWKDKFNPRDAYESIEEMVKADFDALVAQALKAGHRLRIGKRPMTRVGRAVEKGESQGFMKVVVDADSDAILGAAILGVGGDEAVHAILDTMAAGRTAGMLHRTMHIHPTVSELIPTVLGELRP